MIPLEIFYDIVRGPLALFAFLVFFVGTAFQVLIFFILSRKADKIRFRPIHKYKKYSAGRFPKKSMANRLASLKVSVIGIHPVMTTITSIFHVCLFAAPLFLLGHNQLIYESWGIRLFSLPEKITDIMAQLVITCALFFLFRRILVARVRAISTFTDFLILFLTAAPFLTGILAFHQISDYKPIIILHMLSGALMLILLPFTKLVHMIFFFINRFLIAHENSFGSGIRRWYFGGPKFSLKKWYFGKEKFDIEKW